MQRYKYNGPRKPDTIKAEIKALLRSGNARFAVVGGVRVGWGWHAGRRLTRGCT